MNMLNVFYEKYLVGTLIRDSELIYSFKYSDEWIKNENAFQLSLAMPIKKELPNAKIIKRISYLIEKRCQNLSR